MEFSELVRRVANENPDRNKSQGKRIDPGVIPLDKGDPDFPTPEHICEAAREAMRQGYTHYIPGPGDPDLIEAICDNLKKDYGCSYDPKGIIITAGGAGAIYLVCAAFLSPGDEAIVFTPTFASYAHCVTLAGAMPKRVPYARDFSLDQDAVRRAITKRTKAIIVCNPNNPPGKSLTQKEVQFLAGLAVEHKLLLISDEVYRKIYFDGKVHTCSGSVPGAERQTILIDSFSKTYAMTGWRIGYVATTPELAQPMNILRKAGVGNVNVPAQRAALAALRGPQEFVQEMVNEYDRRRKSLIERLAKTEGLHCVIPDSAFYFYGRFDANMKSTDMVDYLYGNGVAVRSGTEYGSNGEGWIRLAYSIPYKDAIEGIERLRAALQKL